jgi:hypothetical protein
VARTALVRLRWAVLLYTGCAVHLCIQVADTRQPVGRRRQSVGLANQQRAALVSVLPVNQGGSNDNGGHLDVPVRAALSVQSCHGAPPPVPTVAPIPSRPARAVARLVRNGRDGIRAACCRRRGSSAVRELALRCMRCTHAQSAPQSLRARPEFPCSCCSALFGVKGTVRGNVAYAEDGVLVYPAANYLVKYYAGESAAVLHRVVHTLAADGSGGMTDGHGRSAVWRRVGATLAGARTCAASPRSYSLYFSRPHTSPRPRLPPL